MKKLSVVKNQKTKYSDDFCEKVIIHLSDGSSLSSFASSLNVSHSTVKRWTTMYPDFGEAVEIATTKAMAFWEGVVKDRALIRDEEAGSNQMLALILKNRFNWADKAELKHDIKAEATVTFKTIVQSDGALIRSESSEQ
jgi:hypothetical protein